MFPQSYLCLFCFAATACFLVGAVRQQHGDTNSVQCQLKSSEWHFSYPYTAKNCVGCNTHVGWSEHLLKHLFTGKHCTDENMDTPDCSPYKGFREICSCITEAGSSLFGYPVGSLREEDSQCNARSCFSKLAWLYGKQKNFKVNFNHNAFENPVQLCRACASATVAEAEELGCGKVSFGLMQLVGLPNRDNARTSMVDNGEVLINMKSIHVQQEVADYKLRHGIAEDEPQQDIVEERPRQGVIADDPQQKTLKAEPQREVVEHGPQQEAVYIEPRQQTLNIEPQLETVEDEPQQETKGNQPQQEIGKVEPQQGPLQPELVQGTVEDEPQQKPVENQSQQETPKVEPRNWTKQARPQQETPKAEPRKGAVEREPLPRIVEDEPQQKTYENQPELETPKVKLPRGPVELEPLRGTVEDKPSHKQVKAGNRFNLSAIHADQIDLEDGDLDTSLDSSSDSGSDYEEEDEEDVRPKTRIVRHSQVDQQNESDHATIEKREIAVSEEDKAQGVFKMVDLRLLGDALQFEQDEATLTLDSQQFMNTEFRKNLAQELEKNRYAKYVLCAHVSTTAERTQTAEELIRLRAQTVGNSLNSFLMSRRPRFQATVGQFHGHYKMGRSASVIYKAYKGGGKPKCKHTDLRT